MIDKIKQKIEEYKKELEKVSNNRDRMMEMLNQQETRIQQLVGAIAAFEKLLQEDKDGRPKDAPASTESKTTD